MNAQQQQQEYLIPNETPKMVENEEQNPSSSSPALQEWETRARAWLSTFPTNVTMKEVEDWLNSEHAPPLPQELKSLSNAQLYQRLHCIHALSQQPPQQQQQVKDDNAVETPTVRFQRTDQWKPVYTWLESLDKDEVVKSKEITDWLAENPDVKEKLFSRHTRYHLMHYVQKLHVKILKRRGKLPKVSKSGGVDKSHSQSLQPVLTTVPVKVIKDAGPIPAVPLSGVAPYVHPVYGNSPSNLLNDKDASLVKRNDAYRRYLLFIELENHLSSILPRHQK